MNSKNWTFKIPKLEGSVLAPISNRQSRVVTDLAHPSVGIYCEGLKGTSHPLYLLGSFSVSPDLWDSRQEIHWGWEAKWITGDAYVVRLRNQDHAAGGDKTHLVGNEVWNPEAERQRLLEFSEAGDIHGGVCQEFCVWGVGVMPSA